MKLGEKLQQLRKKSGLSQEQLAAQLTVSRQAVSKWELDDAVPDTENVIQLSRLFGVSCDYLLREEVDEPGAAPVPAAQEPPQPNAPGETHLDREGWIHNSTILSLTVCATGLLLAIGGGIFNSSLEPAVIGLIIQLGGILLFELAAPRMREDSTTARLHFYSIACWLVLPIPVPFVVRTILLALPSLPSRGGWLILWYALLYLLLVTAVITALLFLRRRIAHKK